MEKIKAGVYFNIYTFIYTYIYIYIYIYKNIYFKLLNSVNCNQQQGQNRNTHYCDSSYSDVQQIS